jgi:hydrogenase large subunit
MDTWTAFDVDPVARVAGPLACHALVDWKERRIVEARCSATLFRGYETILTGRDARDAINIASRVCGVCGGAHAIAAALALEMALDCAPPPLGILVRNLAMALEFLHDHPFHLYAFAGPDYSARIVEATNPGLFARAQTTAAQGRERHGYPTIAAMMEELTPPGGRLYLEAMHMTRLAREAYVLLGGKYPHPQTIVPGGMSATIGPTGMNEVFLRLTPFFDYGKRIAAIWDDLTGFFYAADPRYMQVGARPANLIGTGIFDVVDAYDGTFARAPEWGARRWATPGTIVDGRLMTTDLHAINARIEEFVDRSYYTPSANENRNSFSTDHPWNRTTQPSPRARDWDRQYTWGTAPRWDHLAMEAGCYARLWTTAVGGRMPSNPFIEATGHSLKLRLPRGVLPEMELEWRVPETWNAFERNRARAYCVAWSAMVAMNAWVAAMDRLKDGDTRVSTPFAIPKTGERRGVGFWESGRGYLTHHVVLDGGTIASYQIVTASTWNISPCDRWDHPGPCEEAIMNTPLLEETDASDGFRGIDVLRAVRSFDPCTPCAAH